MAPVLRKRKQVTVIKKTTGSAKKTKRPSRTSVVENVENLLVKHGLSNVAVIGSLDDTQNNDTDAFSKKWQPRLAHSYARVLKLLQKEKNKKNGKAWIWQQQESYTNSFGKIEIVPIFVAVICDTSPTLSVTRVDLQTQTEEIESFAENGLKWQSLPSSNDSIRVLSSNGKNLCQHLLNIRKPSSVNNEQPNPIEFVAVKHNGEDLCWEPLNGSIEEDDDFCDLKETHKPHVKKLLVQEKQKLEREEKEKVEILKTSFEEMVKKIAAAGSLEKDEVKKNLEKMKVYKIFPSDLPQPEVSIFGPTGGFPKKLMVNRIWGKADQYFES